MRATLEYEEERLGELLRLLPPAPEPVLRGAQELPRTRLALEQILALAEADAEFRSQLIADPENAVRHARREPDEPLLRMVRSAIEEGGPS